MSKSDLKLTPHRPAGRDDVWWYEENDGIYVVMEGKDGAIANTTKIKWSSLRAALARKDKKEEDER